MDGTFYFIIYIKLTDAFTAFLAKRQDRATFKMTGGKMDTKWLQDSFDKGKLEVLKFAKTSKIKIDITSLNKKKDERIKLLGSKVIELIENGELDSDLFEPDFSYIKI